MMLLPSIVLGASLGAFLHEVFPVVIVIILLAIVILIAMGKSFFKALQLWAKESKIR